MKELERLKSVCNDPRRAKSKNMADEFIVADVEWAISRIIALEAENSGEFHCLCCSRNTIRTDNSAVIAELEARLALAEKVCEAAETLDIVEGEHSGWCALRKGNPEAGEECDCGYPEIVAALAAWRDGEGK